MPGALPDSRARQTDLASPLAGRRMLFAGLVLDMC
jgi:hypothetical protein